jgi:DNA repair exonuclease SbcCD ATPase subunit
VTTLAPPNWQAPSSEHRLGRAADTPQPSAEEPPRLAQIEQTLERINQELQTLHRAPQAAPQTSPHAEQLRSEVQAVLERLERISHSVAALEGRLQSMPQLINAEVRTSLIDQHHQQRGQLDALQRALPTTSDKPQPLLLGMALLQLVCLGLLIWLMTAR